MNTWHAGVAAAAVELRAIAARMRDLAQRHPNREGSAQAMSNAATLEQAADALAELQPPADDACHCGCAWLDLECDCRQPTGLEVRGG